jgi:hypothetical protein
VAGNPDHKKVSDRTLQRRTWPLAEPAALKEQCARLAQEQGYGRISENASEIVPAAYQGRVKDLFVASDQATLTLRIHEAAEAGDEGLLDFATRQAPLHGGAVYTLTRENMPGAALLAGTYCY